MIGKITGVIDYIGTDHVLIDVRGVGYLVYCSERTMASLPGVGEVTALFTDLVVREDRVPTIKRGLFLISCDGLQFVQLKKHLYLR